MTDLASSVIDHERARWERFCGPVPKDWSFVQFGDLFRERGEFSSDRDTYPLYSFTIEDGVTPKTERYERGFLLKDKDNNQFAVVHPGDFIFNPMNLRFGAISYSKVAFPVLVSGYYVILILNDDRCDTVFMASLLRSKQMMDMYDRIAIGSLVEKRRVHASVLRSVFLPIPSLEEQKAISTILSKWDQGIQQTSELITAKLHLKHGLMQQLLTAQRRFKGFTGDWTQAVLGDVGTVGFSGVDKKSTDGEQEVRLCNYLDVYNNEKISAALQFMCATASDSEIAKYSLKKHDVIITKDSETPDDIAKAAFVAEDLDGVVCGYHLALIRPNQDKIFGPFLSRLLMIPAMRHRFMQIANGATRYGLTLDATKRVPIIYPSIAEQKRIASLADSIDDEIDALTKQLEALKQQKKGLMQKLLTGEVRVKP